MAYQLGIAVLNYGKLTNTYNYIISFRTSLLKVKRNSNANCFKNYNIPTTNKLESCNTRLRSKLKLSKSNESKRNYDHHSMKNKSTQSTNNPCLMTPARYRILVILYGRRNCIEALENMKNFTLCFTRLCSRQLKVYSGKKILEKMRFYHFYARIWGEEMTRKMISGLRRSLLLTGRSFMLSAVCVTPFDWESNNISDAKLETSRNEIETVYDLCSATITCPECSKRLVIDKVIADLDYCHCNGKLGYTNHLHQYDSWQPFIERENIIVWRRKQDQVSNLYSYKVYGTYNDTSLSAFMEVQLNTAFRTQWDSSALELTVVDSHPESNSDLLYWLVKFPTFFANREYVFKRRYKINKEAQEVVIINEIVQENLIPEKDGVHRVREYWSIMVVKANESFQKPGLSYTLTYFDNPGTTLPSTITNFIATSAFPDFLKRVHTAAISLQREWEQGKDVYVSLPPELRNEVEEPSQIISLELSSKKDQEENVSEIETILPTEEIEHKSNEIQLTRISVKYKKSVIDLMEAIEVVAPELDSKTIITKKFEKLFGFDKGYSSDFIEKLHELKKKTKNFIEDSAKKKQESLSTTIKEFDRKRSHYDLEDENTLQFVNSLLKSITEILEADKDMRIGKGLRSQHPPSKTKGSRKSNIELVKVTTLNSQVDLVKADISNSVIEPVVTVSIKDEDISNLSSDYQTETDVKSVTNTTSKLEVEKMEHCLCCSCHESLAWYSFATSWWWSPKDKSYCDNCTCTHKSNSSNSSSPALQNRVNDANGSQQFSDDTVRSSHSYWHYLAFWNLFTGSANVKAQPEIIITKQRITDEEERDIANNNSQKVFEQIDEVFYDAASIDQSLNRSTNDKLNDIQDPNVSWYWRPIKGSYILISKLYTYVTTRNSS